MTDDLSHACDAGTCLRRMVATSTRRKACVAVLALGEAATAIAVLSPLGAADGLFGGSPAARLAALACLTPAVMAWVCAVFLTWHMGRESMRVSNAMMLVPATLIAFLVVCAGDAAARLAIAGALPTGKALLTFALAPLVGPLALRLALLVREAVLQSEPWAQAHEGRDATESRNASGTGAGAAGSAMGSGALA